MNANYGLFPPLGGRCAVATRRALADGGPPPTWSAGSTTRRSLPPRPRPRDAATPRDLPRRCLARRAAERRGRERSPTGGWCRGLSNVASPTISAPGSRAPRTLRPRARTSRRCSPRAGTRCRAWSSRCCASRGASQPWPQSCKLGSGRRRRLVRARARRRGLVAAGEHVAAFREAVAPRRRRRARTPAAARKRRQYLRIGARDLLGLASVGETCVELSSLAEAAPEIAVGHARLQVARAVRRFRAQRDGLRFVVLGMGKLGGDELNFSSDVDLGLPLRAAAAGQVPAEREARRAARVFATRLAEIVTRTLERGHGRGLRVPRRLAAAARRHRTARSSTRSAARSPTTSPSARPGSARRC